MEGIPRQIRLHEATKQVWEFLNKNESDRAWNLIGQLQPSEKARPLQRALDVFLEHCHLKTKNNNLTQAIAEVAALPQSKEKDRLWQRLATTAAYQGKEEEAVILAAEIGDSVERAYALSATVQALVIHGAVAEAQKLLGKIEEEGAREDAVSAIVKELARHGSIQRLVKFIDGLPTKGERIYAAKLWQTELVARHYPKQAQIVRRRYILAA